ncbi:MAG: magnesium transporter [Firmicutes bacterium HGW-Firmicutes-20]|jgi:magnesium transporter|nr:MAG: magnesium transporter [Firmicutes bacterium HGW-Firmicutes-20]PKM89177.1 MAG: magnesium transporter [Firmicutes bacterium HGW-Firmicutes-10]
MVEMMDITSQQLSELIELRQVRNLRSIFDEYNLIDLAEIVEQLQLKEILFLFKTLKKDITAQIFTYLTYEKKQEIIQSFTSVEIMAMLDNLYTDDIVDFLEEMPANIVKQVLNSASAEQRADINLLLSYPEYSAGSIMSTDFVELEATDTVARAIRKIKQQGKTAETISVSYVISQNRELVGTVRLRDILLAETEDTIEDLMDVDVISVKTHDDQESVAHVIKRYDITVVPVVNDENRLIGIITVDDIIDILEDEVTEDIQKMAAIMPIEGSYLKMSIKEMTKSRITWLLVLMVSATFTGTIISGYEDALLLIPALAASIPLIMSTAGNAGSQASAMVIRGIAVGELSVSDYLKVIFKEVQVAILSGLVLFAINWLRLMIFTPETSMTVDLVISLTLMLTVVISKLVGGVLPLIAMFFKQDPAAMAAPLITTMVDAVALMIYFSLAVSMLGL